MAGRVYLVGAGPGDPALVTLRAVELIRRADVILYDYLANPEIVAHARPECECICLGKHGQTRIWTQAEINQRLVADARAGKQVVRLKGGDPAVFGRLAEEVECLLAHGIPYEITPGITTALAATAYAGIPVTHRELASGVALIAAQEDASKPASSLDYRALAVFPGTLVFYMGVTSVHAWTQSLLEAGKPAETPAAIVRRCSLPDQETIFCTLGEVASRMTRPVKMRPPLIVIVGELAHPRHALRWFETRPLFGRSVLVARPAGPADRLSQQLAELGARVLLRPAICISPPDDWAPVDRAIARLNAFDWLVFSSANGVRMLLDRLLSGGRDLRALASVRLAAIGPATAEALREYRLTADLTPDEYRAEALAEALATEARGRKFLLARASRGRDVLGEGLKKAGGVVEEIVVYSSRDVDAADPQIAGMLADGQIDWAAVTSSSIARSLHRQYGELLNNTRLVSISPITSGVLRELGHAPAAEAASFDMPGVVQAILGDAAKHERPA